MSARSELLKQLLDVRRLCRSWQGESDEAARLTVSRAIEESHHALADWKVADRPEFLPEPSTFREAKRQFESLIGWLEKADGGQPPANPAARHPLEVGVSLVEFDPPRINIDGKPWPLKYEAAVWLKWLIECDDRKSDPAFRKAYPDNYSNARPDRWRDDLPEAILNHIDTNHSGSRWLQEGKARME